MTRSPHRWARWPVLAALLAVLLTVPAAGAAVAAPGTAASPPGTARAAAGPPAAAHPVAGAVTYRVPVEGPVVVRRGFDQLDSPYAAGHRGVDLAVGPGGTVLAAAAGVVTFAGPVAGRGVVTVAHADGIRTSYEPVEPSVAAGAVVAAGTPIGRVVGTHGAFPPDTVLHWGARRGEVYVDPLDLLHPLAPVRLLPWNAP